MSQLFTTSSQTHSHSVDIAVFGSSTDQGSHAHSVDIPSTTSTSAGAHDHTVDLPSTPTATVGTSSVMPYVQLLVCRKD
jgi:hypothetical protein